MTTIHPRGDETRATVRRFLYSPTILLTLAALLVSGSRLHADPSAAQTDPRPTAAGAHESPPGATSESGHDDHPAGGHTDPITPVLFGILVIILAARLGGHLFERWNQPAVLGELVIGVLLGNLALAGYDGLDFLKVDYDQTKPLYLSDHLDFAGVTIDHLARIGVILLLFQVGLETNIADFRRVGASAFGVALLGVIAPLLLGWGAGRVLLPDHHWAVHLFLGATLSATSVGITARVLRDLKKSTTKVAQIVLGAAVIDDVLGLIVLAVVQGIIVSLGAPSGCGSGFGAAELGLIIGKSVGFLCGALLLGQYISRSLFKFASALQGGGLLVVFSLIFCFGMAWLSSIVGLAPIVGAFAAGLVLERVQYRELAGRDGHHELEELIRPIGDLLVPIFFVMMGIQVDLRSFADPSALGLAAVLTVCAILGKQVCSLGVLERGVDRRSVGLGMIPRGEVGLIFASIGRGLKLGDERVIDGATYSALVLMVMITTLITPPLLKWSLARHDRMQAEQESPPGTDPTPDPSPPA